MGEFALLSQLLQKMKVILFTHRLHNFDTNDSLDLMLTDTLPIKFSRKIDLRLLLVNHFPPADTLDH